MNTDEAARLLRYARRRGFTFGSVLGESVAEAIWELVDEHDALLARINDREALGEAIDSHACIHRDDYDDFTSMTCPPCAAAAVVA